MLKFSKLQKNPYLRHFVNVAYENLKIMGYTDHGINHVGLVAQRAKMIAERLGMSKQAIELVQIAGYFHDLGNFIGREQHSYWSSFLLYPILLAEGAKPEEITTILNAVVSHDKRELKIFNKESAVVVLADKSDVRRSRVLDWDGKAENDIHDRVNYAAIGNNLLVDVDQKRVILKIEIDTNITPILEYFEIFTDRMVFCREAAEYLGYKFGLVINEDELL